jgi:hypothetical protein
MDDKKVIIIIGNTKTGMTAMSLMMRKLLVEEDIALTALKEPDGLLQFPSDNRAGRRGHRHGTGYWKPQGPANNNNRK